MHKHLEKDHFHWVLLDGWVVMTHEAIINENDKKKNLFQIIEGEENNVQQKLNYTVTGAVLDRGWGTQKETYLFK